MSDAFLVLAAHALISGCASLHARQPCSILSARPHWRALRIAACACVFVEVWAVAFRHAGAVVQASALRYGGVAMNRQVRLRMTLAALIPSNVQTICSRSVFRVGLGDRPLLCRSVIMVETTEVCVLNSLLRSVFGSRAIPVARSTQRVSR